ncbi:MAG: class I SAM-dependent methyltransferase [Candidatus Melainabacteria bacterium]|nr:class I SAM-dependent methyltransferase [Candidatus Melainabacteria bacterium]
MIVKNVTSFIPPQRFSILASSAFTQVPSLIQEAWHNPVINQLIKRSILNGNFKNNIELGQTFIGQIDRLCNSALNDEGIYKHLHEFFKQVSIRDGLEDNFISERNERIQRRAKQVKDLLEDYLPDNLLDVGCGNGDITNEIRESLMLSSQSVIGLEVSSKQNVQLPFQLLIYDGFNFPLADKSFNLITLLTTLHHAENPRKLLQEIYRVLKPNAYLIVRDFDSSTEELKTFNLIMDYLFYKVYIPCSDVPIPGNYLGFKDWLAIFREEGFKDKKIVFPEPNNPYKPFMVLLQKEK